MKISNRFKILLIAFFGLASSSMIAQNTACELDWRYARIGDLPNIQYAGDIDNDGITEMIVSAASTNGGYWYIMEYDSTTDRYQQVWVSDQYIDSYVYSIRVMDLGGDGTQEILVCDKFVNVQVFNATDLSLVGEFDLLTAGLNEMILADADNDDVDEIVVTSDLKTFIINTQTFNVEWEIDQGGRHMQVGQVDDDPALEIVFSDGEVLEHSNGVLTEEWNAFDDTYPNWRFVRLVDADSDPAKEIAISIDKTIYIYDASNQSLINSTTHEGYIQTLLYTDYNSNGTKEFIVGSSGGDVYVYDVNLYNGNKIIEGFSPFDYFTMYDICSMQIADVDNDGSLNIILTEGCGISSGESIRVYTTSGDLLSKSYHLDAPFYDLELVDIGQDGNYEFIGTTSGADNIYGPPTLFILDAVTGKELDIIPEFSVYYIQNIEKGDLDGDGDFEIVSSGVKLVIYDENLQAQDSSNNITLIERSLKLADLDQNGTLEIIFRSNGGFHCYDKNLDFYGEYFYNGDINSGSIEVIDITGDSKPEIVTCSPELLVFDNEFNLLYNSPSSSYEYKDVAVTDWNNDGELDILAGTSFGNIHFINASDFSIFDELDVSFSSDVIHALRVDDINNDGIEELVIAHNNTIYLYTKLGELFEIAHPSIGTGFGVWESLKLIDIDNDGFKELIISNDYAISVYETNCYELITSTKPTLQFENKIQLFPNPTSDFIQVKIEGITVEQIEKVALFDISGKLVKEFIPATSFSVESLQQGIYFMTFKIMNGEIITKKIVKI